MELWGLKYCAYVKHLLERVAVSVKLGMALLNVLVKMWNYLPIDACKKSYWDHVQERFFLMNI